MWFSRIFLVFVLTIGSAAAQNTAPAREIRLRLGQIAARAEANFRSSDSIEARLRAEGLTLHPELIALRLRIEAALDDARSSLAQNDDAGAAESLGIAQALLDRFARRIGGY